MPSSYSPEETILIMCITRERACKVGDCINCGWIRDETRDKWKKWIEEKKKEA